ncbi:hypothetical protein G6F42_020189 [Rhizopus arrhizus]|nr:hypothetical protein G6F42_020189 [Rhizopus arrhizus]
MVETTRLYTQRSHKIPQYGYGPQYVQRQFEDNLTIDPHLNCQYAENYCQVVRIAFVDISTASQTTFIETTVLAATNVIVDQNKDLAIMAFPGDHTTASQQTKPSGMPPHELKLKDNQPHNLLDEEYQSKKWAVQWNTTDCQKSTEKYN